MDIYTQNGLFESKSNIENSLGTKLTILKYNTLKTIIPPQWRKTIKQGQKECIRRSDYPLLKINTLWKSLEKNIKSKNINQKSVCDKIKKPTAQETWINIYPFLENFE